MPSDGTSTRERILDAAEPLVLDHGFSGTSLDRVLARTGFTKGAFFYHFRSKADLARALVERYAARDRERLEAFLEQAEALSGDPLAQVLRFVGQFEELAEVLNEPEPGCLFASYCYQSGQFDPETIAVIGATFEAWRHRLGEKLEAVASCYPPRLPVDPASLADLLTAVFEGAFIMAKTLKDPHIVAGQLGHYRNYLQLLFGPPAESMPAATGEATAPPLNGAYMEPLP